MITGRLDVVCNNAGHMVFGPLEAFTPEQLAELYDVNVLSSSASIVLLCAFAEAKSRIVVWVSIRARPWYSPSPHLILQQRRGWMRWRWCRRAAHPLGHRDFHYRSLARSPENNHFAHSGSLPILSASLSMRTDRTKTSQMNVMKGLWPATIVTTGSGCTAVGEES